MTAPTHPSTVTHLIDEEKHFRVVVELRRRQIAIEARIPKDATADEITIFAAQVSTSMRRKLAELAARKERQHGQVEGASEGKVPGADATGAPEKEEDPKGGGPQGGTDEA